MHPDPRSPLYRLREMGITCAGQRGVDDTRTLQSFSFEIGDYIDVAITTPVVQRSAGRGRGGGRPY